MQVYESYIHKYTADIRRSTYHILAWSKRYVLCSICTYVHIYDFRWAVYCLVCSSICMYFQYILAYIDTVMGRTYVSICMYMHVFLSKIHAYTSSTYMNVFPTVYLAVVLYVFSTVLKMRTVSAPSVSAPCARSLPLRRAVATASLSHGSASACRSPHSIKSGLCDWTAAASGNFYRRAFVARWSAMAILVGGRSRGNSGAATSH